MEKRGEPRHPWRFLRSGGVDQVILATGADLLAVATLDQKLWTALACPTAGLEIDERTLKLVDVDGDGRIRPPDLLAAIRWAGEVFKDLDDLFMPQDAISLSGIHDGTERGREVLAGARRILASLEKGDAPSIALADVADTEKIFAKTRYNGDGVVPAESADDPSVRRAIEDIVSVTGGAADRSGGVGVDQARLDAFFGQATAYADWFERGRGDAQVMCLGAATEPAASALREVRAKIDDYFVRCRLAAMDVRFDAGLHGSEADLAPLALKELGPQDASVAKLPIARVEPSRPLPLSGPVNPAWSERLARFVEKTLLLALGPRASLTEGDWDAVCKRFAPYEAWAATKPGDAALEKLGPERVCALARGGERAQIAALIARDAALAAEYGQIEAVEKTIRLRRDLVALVRNFVNFSDFYGRRRAAFQAGTLYIDGRSCELCLPVADVGKHATLAALARAYLVYCDCRRRSDAEARKIVAVVTAGDVDNLMVGRNAVFYDRAGADWDATVTKVVENPVGIRQAFWAPYKRFVRLVEEQIAKRAGDADAGATKTLAEHAASPLTASGAAAAASPPEGAPKPKTIDVGTVAAIGVAVGGIATFFSSILATFLGMGMWMPFGLGALLLAISGPSMLIAWLKLRQRNIGPVLDANGWAVNAFARINGPFGAALTSVGTLPPGASRSLSDPFAEKSRPWRLYAAAAVVAALGATWFFGKADDYLPDQARASTVLHRTARGAAAAVVPAK